MSHLWRPAPLAGGDRAPVSWREWLDRHGAGLVLYARQWTRSRADAEDAMQTAFVQFWQRREAVEDPTAYLYACVRTAALNVARASGRRARHEVGGGEVPEPMFVADVGANLRREAVEEALAQLPADQREILVLKVWSGLTFAQIGEVLKLNPSTAASRYRYGLEKLEGLLAEEVRP